MRTNRRAAGSWILALGAMIAGRAARAQSAAPSNGAPDATANPSDAGTRSLAASASAGLAQAESTSRAPSSGTPAASAPAASSAEVAEAARRLFREGVQLANQGRWEDARHQFRLALAVRPSPLLRYNLAIAAQNSGHFVEAIDQYRQFLLEDSDPANALRRQWSQESISTLELSLGVLVISVQGTDAAAEILLDGHVVPLALLGVEIPVDPTEHVIEAEGTHGSHARQSIRLGEGWVRTVTLVLRPDAVSGAPAARHTNQPSEVRAPREEAVPPGTIERVRRVIEERAATADEYGRRRWQRNSVVYAFNGIGNPSGILGVGYRWAARPWFEFELQAGGGHPFGPGGGVYVSARNPWSYRYAVGLTVGISTNYTEIHDPTPGGACLQGSVFVPVWFSAAITHEWRVSTGFTFRLALGARFLLNWKALSDAVVTHCETLQPAQLDRQPVYLFFDPPSLDHSNIPVLPYLMFDIGYAL